MHPRFRQLPPPVIVIGMHRSGTSLVAAILARLGVQLGADSQILGMPGIDDAALIHSGYGESAAFRECNEALLHAAGATWDRPEPYLEAGPGSTSEALRLAVATHTSLRGFFGPSRSRKDSPWGWKDPRTSLTLPAWLELFPTARVLHVRRAPEGAARSLVHRAAQEHARAQTAPPLPPAERLRWWLRHPAQAGRRAIRRILGNPVRPELEPCADLEYGIRLAELYQVACERHRELASMWLEVRYEDLLADPLGSTRRVADFCTPGAQAEQVVRAAELVRRG